MQVENAKLDALQASSAAVAPPQLFDSSAQQKNQFGNLLDHLVALRNQDADERIDTAALLPHEVDDTQLQEVLAVVRYQYDILYALAYDAAKLIDLNWEREEKSKDELTVRFDEEARREEGRERECHALADNDPYVSVEPDGTKKSRVGNHLTYLTKLEALTRVEGLYRSNNDPESAVDTTAMTSVFPTAVVTADKLAVREPTEVADMCTALLNSCRQNFSTLNRLMARKDGHFVRVKDELTAQMVERRQREEEVVNWSYILKYLLVNSSKLRKELQRERRMQASQGAPRQPFTQPTISDTRWTFGRSMDGPPSTSDERRSESTSSMMDSPEKTAAALPTNRPAVSNEMTPLDRVKQRAEFQRQEMEHGIDSGHEKLGLRLSHGREAIANNRLVESDPELYDQIGPPAADGLSPLSPPDLTSDPPVFAQHVSLRHQQQYQQQLADDAMYSQSSRPPSEPRSGTQSLESVSISGNRSRMNSADPSVASSSAVSTKQSQSSLHHNRSNGKQTPGHRSKSPASRGHGGHGQSTATQQPSDFARHVARGLGLVGQQAVGVMSVVDRVSRITPDQLSRMDAETREQILEVRRDLGLDRFERQFALEKEQQAAHAASWTARNPAAVRSAGAIPEGYNSDEDDNFSQLDQFS